MTNPAKRRKANRRGGTDQRRWRFEKLIERDGWDCWVCGHPMDPDAKPNADERASIDHVVRECDGGTYALENLRLSHRICNQIRD